MALSSAQCQLIDDASPINNDFSIGNRIKYLTTAGVLASGTISGCDISSGTASGLALTNPTITNVQYTIATGGGSGIWGTTISALTKGNYIIDPATGVYYYITTTPTTGDIIEIVNMDSGADAWIEFSSAASAESVVFASSTGTAYVTLKAMNKMRMMNITSTHWVNLGSTSVFSSWGKATA